MQHLNYLADRDQVIEVLNAAMQHDRLGRYIQFDAYDLPNTPIIKLGQSLRFWHDLLDSLHDAGAIFAETLDAGGVSVWCPPNFVWPEEAGVYLSSAMQSFGAIGEAAKHRRLGDSPYWYLFLIGRDPSYVGRSVAPRIIKPILQKAREDRLPVWLEATSERSKKVYESLGFKVAEELTIGKGECNETGELVEGGEGVKIWAMVANQI